MKIMYIFPHPDDESFGPAPAISKQVRQGHEIYLLTLTKGGATKQRHKYNYSIEEMGNVREKEMQSVKDVLNISNLTVLDLPDSGLDNLDPKEIENPIKEHVKKINPDIIVTYPIHGISGFHDHIVTHEVVKRVFLELKNKEDLNLKRLAFFTVSEKSIKDHEGIHKLNFSKEEEIDCVFKIEDIDLDNFKKALDCYETYQEVIENSKIKEFVGKETYFEIFQENLTPSLEDLTEKL